MTPGVRTVAIAGAGIGGLAAALALARRRIQSHIFERRRDHAEDGAGIQIGPNGTKVLSEIGVLDSVKEHACAPDAISVHDGKTGRVLSRLPLGRGVVARHSSPYLTLHRQDLHAALLAKARSDQHINFTAGCEVTSFAADNDGAVVSLASGANFQASALIAADGLWSLLRNQVSSSHAPQPYGKCAFRTVLPISALPEVLSRNDVHIWLNPGTHVVHYPVRQGNEVALVLIADGTNPVSSWNSECAPALQATTVAPQFAPALQKLLSLADHWRSWPLQTLPPLSKWTTGCVALLGDAAHPVLPFLAQGAALALEDAVSLAARIAETDLPMPKRLAAYENDRRARAHRVAEASLTNGRIYHLGGVSAVARDAVLVATPPALLMRRYDWLYGWTP